MAEASAGAGTPYFLDSLHGWMFIGFEGNSRPGKLLATEDGGKTWNWVNSPGSSGRITFHSLRDGWLVTEWRPDKLYVTHDGSKTWQDVSVSRPAEVGAATSPIFQGPPVFKDKRSGFLVVDYSWKFGTPSKLVTYSTDDSGQSWQAIKVLEEARDAWGMRGVPFSIVDSALIVSTGSRDSNVTVAAVLLEAGPSHVRPSYGAVNEITFGDKSNGWVAGPRSGLLATHDGGSTWKHIGPKPLYTPSRSWTAPAVKGPPMVVTHE